MALTRGVAGAPAQLRPWTEYRTIMWVGDSAYKDPARLTQFFNRLREMGINTAMVTGDADPRLLLENHFPYYVENIVNRGLCLKWNSKVRDWDKFVTDWARAGRPESALTRDYCLDDPKWQEWARNQVRAAVNTNAMNAPVAYDLRDELSVTISANPFDYDFNPLALAKFREWLKTQYSDLAALNKAWETSFKTVDEVKPFTTDQIKNRMASGKAMPEGQADWQQLQQLRFDPMTAAQNPTRWNFSPWADFRTYMDISLARALADLRQGAHELDPKTPVGIEGTQMPSAFGGYNLWRLSQVLDWVEPYDIGNAREILGSFMPGQTFLTTVSESDTDQARRRLWHLLLEGDRGCIVWWSEDCIDWKTADYKLTPKAQALAPVLKEMSSPLAKLFLGAEPVRDPVYIHYSQPSVQVDWLLESTVDGSTWLRRFSSFEADHNRQAKVRNGWLKALQDLGFSPQFISSEQIERGGLRNPGNAILVLPNSWALSALEAAEIQGFLSSLQAGAAARQVFCDGPPGLFDETGKLRSSGALTALVSTETFAEPTCVALGKGGRSSQATAGAASYPEDRLKGTAGSDWSNWLARLLKTQRPDILVPTTARARLHRYQIPRGELIAVERNVDYHMSEDLKQAGGNRALERPVAMELILAQPAHLYDLRARKYLGQVARITFTLDAWQPSLFARLKERVAAESIVQTLLNEEEPPPTPAK